jgi:perosamine synthetase
LALCNQHKLALLEDCSHAHGARYKGQLVGTFGLAAAWSFNGPKIISGGEGGMILTDDKDIEVRCNLLGQYNNRALQITPQNHSLREIALTGLGLKHRITTVAAAMANEQLEHLDDWLNWKRFYANMFRQALADITFIRLPEIENTQPAWYAFTFYFDEDKAGISRDAFIKRLQALDLKEIKTPGSTCPQEQLALYRQPSRYLPQLYDQDPPVQNTCPHSNHLYQLCIKMPMWAQSSDLGMVNKYIQGIRAVALALMAAQQPGEDRQRVMGYGN